MYDSSDNAAVRFAYGYLRAPLPARDPDRDSGSASWWSGSASPLPRLAATFPRAEPGSPAPQRHHCGLSTTCEQALTGSLASLLAVGLGQKDLLAVALPARCPAPLGASLAIAAAAGAADRRPARSEAGRGRAEASAISAGLQAKQAELAAPRAKPPPPKPTRNGSPACSPKAKRGPRALSARVAALRSRQLAAEKAPPARARARPRAPARGDLRERLAGQPTSRHPRLRRLRRTGHPRPNYLRAIQKSDTRPGRRVAERPRRGPARGRPGRGAAATGPSPTTNGSPPPARKSPRCAEARAGRRGGPGRGQRRPRGLAGAS